MLKGEFYEQARPLRSLHLTRDPVFHKSQRKYWNKAFQSSGTCDIYLCVLLS
jgi:hypothetical protein